MELLYVWVEEYGNIKRQGFNFSPNYWFEVDENNNLLDKTVEREKEGRLNKQPNEFFGNRISNITTIVGKNGSGKSTVLEILTKINYYLTSKNNLFNKPFKIVILNGDELKRINSEDKLDKIQSLSYLYYCEDWTRVVKNDLKNISFAKKNHAIEQERGTIEIKKTNDIMSSVIVSNICNQLSFIEFLNKKENKFTNIFSRFSEIKLIFSSFSQNEYKENFARKHFKNTCLINDTSKEGFLSIIFDLIFEYSEYSGNFESYVNNIDNRNWLELEKTCPKDWELLKELKEIDKIFTMPNPKIDTIKEKLKVLLKEYKKDELIDFLEIYVENKIVKGIENNGRDLEFILQNTKENRERLGKLAKYFKSIDISYSKEMSKGEFDTLSIFSNLYTEIIDEDNENIFILLDEPANSFHPEWQREFIRDFVEFSKLFESKKLQIILTSHSPFVASDLPRENVIMLDVYNEKDKETKKDEKTKESEQEIGNCKVLKDKDIKTFGANIFDLYSNAFFIESSFGEFAKGKIKEVVEWLKYEEDEKTKERNYINEGKINKEQIEYILNSIGEPLVKNKLQKMYDEYLNHGKDKNTQIEIVLKKMDIPKDKIQKILEAIKDD